MFLREPAIHMWCFNWMVRLLKARQNGGEQCIHTEILHLVKVVLHIIKNIKYFCLNEQITINEISLGLQVYELGSWKSFGKGFYDMKLCRCANERCKLFLFSEMSINLTYFIQSRWARFLVIFIATWLPFLNWEQNFAYSVMWYDALTSIQGFTYFTRC